MRDDDLSFPFKATTYRIVGCFREVFRELGPGFNEHVYRRALYIALRQAGFDVLTEHSMRVVFRGFVVGSFKADLVVDRSVLVEVKAATGIEAYAVAQTLNYLKAAGGGVGLLLNFGKFPEHQRLVQGDCPANSLPDLQAPET